MSIRRFTKKRNRSHKRPSSFSFPLFFIAILHFTVFSIGVCETPLTAQTFFLRENSNFKTFNTWSNNWSTIEKQLQLQHISSAALLQQFKLNYHYLEIINNIKSDIETSLRNKSSSSLDQKRNRIHQCRFNGLGIITQTSSDTGDQGSEEGSAAVGEKRLLC